MTRDRSSIWVGLADLLLCVLAVVIVAVNPREQANGVEMKAEILVTADWSVDIDADVDLWMAPSSREPVSYAARDVGCAKLDADNRGFMDGMVTLADGSATKVESNKETISLRCKDYGHYDLAVNLYGYRINGVTKFKQVEPIKVHVEVVQINPTVKVLFAKDVYLDKVGQTINWASFDMDRAGKVTWADPPLEPVTSRHTHASAGGQP